MEKKKLSLSDLEVKSFATSSTDVKGGTGTGGVLCQMTFLSCNPAACTTPEQVCY
jgi:hypothetical protein